VKAWRAWRPILPAGFRQMPPALAADRRLGLPTVAVRADPS
jgi:hypothetical protein